jgi:hypothetical protein
VVSEKVDPQRFVFVDEMGTTTSLSVLRAWVASWTAGVVLGAAQPRGKRTPPCLPGERGEDLGPSLLGLREQPPLPSSRPTRRRSARPEPTQRGLGVVVMDNFTAHKGERLRENWSSSGDASYSVPAALLSLLS